MCCRKYMMYIIAVLITVAILIFLYFFLFYDSN